MKRSIIAVILIIAAKSIYMKSESGHKKGEPDVVGTFSINRDENITVVANRENIEDREVFASTIYNTYSRCKNSAPVFRTRMTHQAGKVYVL